MGRGSYRLDKIILFGIYTPQGTRPRRIAIRGGPSRLILVLVVAFFACAAVRDMNVFTFMCARSFGKEPVPWRRASGVCIVLVLRSADTPNSQGCGHGLGDSFKIFYARSVTG